MSRIVSVLPPGLKRTFAALMASSVAVWAAPISAYAALPTTSAALSGNASSLGPEDEEDVVIIDDEMEGGEGGDEGGGDEGGTTPPAGDGGDIDIFGDDEGTDPIVGGGGERKVGEAPGKLDPESEEKQIKNEMGLINVVQRQRMLKKKRFELAPQVGLTINDPYVRHYTIGLDLNYWLTNRMAIGLTGTGFIGNKTPRYDNIRFQEGLLLTANQTLWQAHVNFSYNPFYGKIAIFNRALLHWEVSTTIGAGALQTRVIPRYESLHEPFSTITGGGVLGLVARTYMPKINFISYELGTRFWVYPDKLEPSQRGPDTGVGGLDLPELDSADGAKGASDFQVAFNVTVYLGVTFFFPTSFDYTTPR